jgi:predicted nucleic acid-binding protein
VRICFHPSVLISAFTTRGLSADLFRLVVAEHELLIGEGSLKEVRRVLRDRLEVPPAEIALVEDQLRPHTVVDRPADASQALQADADDAEVLAAALAGRAQLLVTGDGSLSGGAERSPVPILDPRACWDRLQRIR